MYNCYSNLSRHILKSVCFLEALHEAKPPPMLHAASYIIVIIVLLCFILFCLCTLVRSGWGGGGGVGEGGEFNPHFHISIHAIQHIKF